VLNCTKMLFGSFCQELRKACDRKGYIGSSSNDCIHKRSNHLLIKLNIDFRVSIVSISCCCYLIDLVILVQRISNWIAVVQAKTFKWIAVVQAKTFKDGIDICRL